MTDQHKLFISLLWYNAVAKYPKIGMELDHYMKSEN